jgi:hypothetical protein
MDEASWVAVVRARNDRPPMIWPSLRAMSEADLRALFRYSESLPVKGEAMPAWVPPGEEPKTPYFVMDPQAPRPAR